jgi:hypothetical protein
VACTKTRIFGYKPTKKRALGAKKKLFENFPLYYWSKEIRKHIRKNFFAFLKPFFKSLKDRKLGFKCMPLFARQYGISNLFRGEELKE